MLRMKLTFYLINVYMRYERPTSTTHQIPNYKTEYPYQGISENRRVLSMFLTLSFKFIFNNRVHFKVIAGVILRKCYFFKLLLLQKYLPCARTIEC